MNNPSAVYIQVAPADITFICKIMEGYEHLGVVTTLDRAKGLLAIRATPDTRQEVLAIVTHLPVPYLLVDSAE
jgi:hypothetical protein